MLLDMALADKARADCSYMSAAYKVQEMGRPDNEQRREDIQGRPVAAGYTAADRIAAGAKVQAGRQGMTPHPANQDGSREERIPAEERTWSRRGCPFAVWREAAVMSDVGSWSPGLLGARWWLMVDERYMQRDDGAR